MGNGILAPYIFRSYDKKFQKSTINICLVVCILVFAPQVHIELPLGSSRGELHFWAMGFGLLFHLGALKKIQNSLIYIGPVIYILLCTLCTLDCIVLKTSMRIQGQNLSSTQIARVNIVLGKQAALQTIRMTSLF